MLGSFKQNIIAIVLVSIFIIGTITVLQFRDGGMRLQPPLPTRDIDMRKHGEHEDRHRPPHNNRRDRNHKKDIEETNDPHEPLPNPNDNPFNKIDQVYKKNIKLNKDRANQVKEAMKFAWDRYRINTWGEDELRPISNQPNKWFGLGITIIDSIDTLHIMGLKDEFEQAKKFIKDLDFLRNNDKINVFESVIRILGGLLSSYHLSGDKMFLDKAEEFGLLLLNAFDKKNPLPFGFLNLKTKEALYLSWTGGCAILSEFGTMFLEFENLSHLTGNPIWKQKSDKILETLKSYNYKVPGLVPLMLRPDGKSYCSNQISLGANGDSYYEYLIKTWIYSNKKDDRFRDMYVTAANSLIDNLYHEVKGVGYVSGFYEGAKKSTPQRGTQEHLACFSGGMFALSAAAQVSKDPYENKRYMEVGEKITETCYKSYEISPTGLGPEHFDISAVNGNITLSGGDRFYKLRPETVESIFVLYRLTGDTKYQEWNWNIFQAIQKHCRTDNGFVGLMDINHPEQKDDLQQSFFMAETLKYLYLTFTDSGVIPLDQYVFNTEAHPLKVVS